MESLTRELGILQHTLGLDQYGRGSMYRNHFVSGPGHHDQTVIDALVSKGLMEQSFRVSPGLLGEGGTMFFVTDAGIKWVQENSPKPPKKTKAKERYQRWLEYRDSFDSFLDFCYWDARPEREWNGGAS